MSTNAKSTGANPRLVGLEYMAPYLRNDDRLLRHCSGCKRLCMLPMWRMCSECEPGPRVYQKKTSRFGTSRRAGK